MSAYLEFAARHPYLIGAFIVVLVILIASELAKSRGGAKALSIIAATRLMNGDDTIVLDVRPHTEFKTAHIEGAKNIALSVLKQQIANVSANKDAPILVYCNVGMNAKTAANLLLKSGYSNVTTLKGGISAWQADNMPVGRLSR